MMYRGTGMKYEYILFDHFKISCRRRRGQLNRCFSSSRRSHGKHEARAEFSNGRTLKFDCGTYARMADGATVASLGDTSVLVTAVSKSFSGTPGSFLPLTVDYRQKYAAAGRIPSNYLRRETAPTEKEILTGRLIDRSVRPMFPEGYLYDTQLSCQPLAVDSVYDPNVISINAASAALAVSDIPWTGPVGAVRVGLLEGEVVTNPTKRELNKSELDMIITGAKHNMVVMLEGGGSSVLQQDLMKAIKTGVKECQHIISAIENLAKICGKPKREFVPANIPTQEMLDAARVLCHTRLRSIFTDFSHNKLSRDAAVNALRIDVIKKLQSGFPGKETYLLVETFSKITKEVFRNLILNEDIRCDGRGLQDLRDIRCQVELHRPLHGSSMFQRGQTQVQCTVAFDAPEAIHKLDPLLEATGGHKDRNFLLHYSFPAFANNEVGRGGPVSRREIGHGALAERALRPLIPKDHHFAILLTSIVMESNGSSSMATVCGGSMALMDAGVKISAPAAGVAIGLITHYDEDGKLQNYKTLTDILGIEDYMGDMDFKMAGTRKGITALQADIKLKGIPLKVVMEAIQQGTEAKSNILSIMHETIPSPREGHKETMPVVENITVPPHKRAQLIGPGGLNIRNVQANTGVQITWQSDGSMSVFAPNGSAMEEAKESFSDLMKSFEEPTLEFGGIYTASIVEIRPQGVMVTLYDNMLPVLVHNSQLDTRKVQHPSALGLEVGQDFKIKYFGRDPTSGQMRLSRRALIASIAATKNLHTSET